MTLEKDYSVRASGVSRDEIGSLVTAFNEMLEEIRQQESALRSARDGLEQRVAERTVQLRAANKELEAFSYSVSHDLRAPLRSIEGFSRALMEDCADGLSDAGQDSLRRIIGSTVRMGQLIDGLLNLSRVTRAEVRGRSVDLSSLAGELVAELRSGEDGRQVECVIAKGAVVEGAPARGAAEPDRERVEIHPEARLGPHRVRVRRGGGRTDLFCPGQRGGVRDVLLRQAVRRIPASARAGRVPGDRDRSGHRPAHRDPSRRTGVGHRRSRRGGDRLLHSREGRRHWTTRGSCCWLKTTRTTKL